MLIADHPWVSAMAFTFGTVWIAVLSFMSRWLFKKIITANVCSHHIDCERRIVASETEIQVLRTRAVDKDDFKSLRTEWGEKIDALLKEVKALTLAFVRSNPQAEIGDR